MFSSLYENILTSDITVPMQEEPFESVTDLASAGFYISFQNDYNFFGFDQLCTPNITGQCYSKEIFPRDEFDPEFVLGYYDVRKEYEAMLKKEWGLWKNRGMSNIIAWEDIK
jgi:hypothetical protein